MERLIIDNLSTFFDYKIYLVYTGCQLLLSASFLLILLTLKSRPQDKMMVMLAASQSLKDFLFCLTHLQEPLQFSNTHPLYFLILNAILLYYYAWMAVYLWFLYRVTHEARSE